MEEKIFHAVRNSLGGYEIIPVDGYNNQGDIIATGSEVDCQAAIEKDKEEEETE